MSVMVEVRITARVDDAAAAEPRDRIIAFDLATTGLPDGRSLGCFLRDADAGLIAGLDGFSWGGHTARGCAVVRVDSHTFQAPGFYEKLGYERIGFATDTPIGHGEAFFSKRLNQNGARAATAAR
jgi:hypothetical protein